MFHRRFLGAPMKSFAVASQIACLLLFTSIACCQEVPDRQIGDRLRVYLKPFVESGNFTGAVLVARRGKVLLRQGYGMASYELSAPNLDRKSTRLNSSHANISYAVFC